MMMGFLLIFMMIDMIGREERMRIAPLAEEHPESCAEHHTIELSETRVHSSQRDEAIGDHVARGAD